CDPFNDASVFRLFKIKNRSLSKYLPILTSKTEHLSQLVEITNEANMLMNHFWPGQLTIILKLKSNSLTSKYAFDKSVAIRIPNNICTINLIQMTKNKFLVGTSANLSNTPPFNNLENIHTSVLHGYDAIVDGGLLNNSLHVSTIVDLVEFNNPKIIREGIISRDKIFTVLKEFL
ncbi:MAG: Sua5/YciO/YrdC/YwlC family protein, partial [Nitrosopumilus sp.]|nr:Sua5/YciO/YrdC/YwlC family protein [Nitrosopumilus sp.]